MKKITFLMAALMVSAVFTTVKGQLDVGCTDIPNVPNGTTVYPNINTLVQYTRQNFGSPVTTADVDSFTMEILVNLVKHQAFYRNMSTSFPAAGSETTQGATALDWGSLGISPGSNSLCVQTRLWKNGTIVDVNTSNDAFCVTVNYSGDGSPLTYDLALLNAHIEDPLLPQGSHIPKGTIMSLIGFDVQNTSGAQQIPAGVTFSVNVELNGVPYGPYNGTIAAGLSPGGTTSYTIDALGFGIFLPTDATEVDLCVEFVASPDDTDHNNDRNCGTYITGIEDIAETTLNIFYNNNNLNIDMLENANGVFELNVVSVSGQRALTQKLNADDNREFNIATNDLNPGLYVANITSSNGESISYKFIKN